MLIAVSNKRMTFDSMYVNFAYNNYLDQLVIYFFVMRGIISKSFRFTIENVFAIIKVALPGSIVGSHE